MCSCVKTTARGLPKREEPLSCTVFLLEISNLHWLSKQQAGLCLTAQQLLFTLVSGCGLLPAALLLACQAAAADCLLRCCSFLAATVRARASSLAS